MTIRRDIVGSIVVLGCGFLFGYVVTVVKKSFDDITSSEKLESEVKKKKKECCGSKKKSGEKCNSETAQSIRKIVFLNGSKSGAAKIFAENVFGYVKAFNETIDLSSVDINNVTIQEVEEIFKDNSHVLYVLIMSSYPSEFCENFLAYLTESATDWRIGKGFLNRSAGLLPIIMGDSTFGEDLFCQPGIEVSKLFSALGGKRSSSILIDNMNKKADDYFKDVCQLIDDAVLKGKVNEAEDEDEDSDVEADLEFEMEESSCQSGKAVDLEDLANVMPNGILKKGSVRPQRVRVRKAMINDKLRGALTKQGYHLVGSHSGVKICRWTKSQLRGRGGCYKHSFYGIESHRCMEATPSLACANKCVFCWRHHTNPVGTEWRWLTDKPEAIISGLLDGHRKMIKQLRGVPGVTNEKMIEANNPIHCALSLVGEPIMYPHINSFVDLLHSRGISTYLVTNAQFPNEIVTLPPITQLYASIDGSTRDELKAIDRPLHKDFWERFVKSLENMSNVCGRTVYRLTLVTGFNLSDTVGYVNLVKLGNPDFIEVKGVTYCGTSNNAELSMKNVPWHDQVIEFCAALADSLPEYDIACEHEHSNCVLISHHRFKTEFGWKTWIDYPRFQQLYDEWKENGIKFSAVDYSVDTPSWAVYGSDERGFDPEMIRHHRNRKIRTFAPGANAPILLES